MSSAATSFVSPVRRKDRLEMMFAELSELAGQRNAIDGRIVEIVADMDRENLVGMTGARSISALIAWKLGVAPRNAETIVAIADRRDEFPRCTTELREGRLSLDQVGVIAENAADGSDDHYAQLAESATVTQLRRAISLAPKPPPAPKHDPGALISKHTDGTYTTWKIRLGPIDAAKFDAALQSHHDAQIADWKRERDNGDGACDQAPPFPTNLDAFNALVEAGWDTDVAARPHGQRTTVVVHVDVEKPAAGLHLGPVLSDADRRYLLCDATCEAWFERYGQVIGSGRETRTISRRLRRALEHRDHGTCVVPGCGATRGLHAHHIQHWEDGGPTELFNLVLVCPFHHRLHHSGGITITGPAGHLVVTDDRGRPLQPGSLARPPTTAPPSVPPYKGPTGERAQWWWYNPFEPRPPTAA